MKTIDEILDEWYPTIPDEEHNGLYARDKVKLIAQEFADQFCQPVVMQRSEQLISLLEKLLENNMCSHAGDELIEQMLKEINCT